MAKNKVTPKNIATVMLRFAVHVAGLLTEPEALKAFCGDFDAFLDDQASQDAFGTEGQCDPRGDQRD